MSEKNQDQVAGKGAIAIQSARDTIINAGISANDMRAIMETLAAQIPTFTAMARDIVNERLQDFEEKVLQKFSTASQSVNPEAFKDPDFQYLLNRAQNAYARSGEEVTRD